jgi:hypothetical protein
MAKVISGDTVLCNELSSYIKVLSEEGFREVLQLPFIGWNGQHESFSIYFHDRDGILLSLYTLGGDRVHGGSFFFNWRPNYNSRSEIDSLYPMANWTVKGDRKIFLGCVDSRENLRWKLQELRQNGVFIKPWPKRPWLWLLHSEDERSNFREINDERIALLPEEVQFALALREG